MRGSRCPIGIASAILAAACVFGSASPSSAEKVVASRDTIIAAARDMMAQARLCALITIDPAGYPHARTMDPFPPDENMVVRMGTADKTRKVAEIRKDPRVALYYAHPKGYGYVSLHGTARIVEDPEETAKWFKSGWARLYPPDRKGFVVIAVAPVRLEVVDYQRGLVGDTLRWVPPSVEFK